MATQNLVSAVLSARDKADVLEKLASVKATLGFLITLRNDELQALFKAGDVIAPFVEKAYNVATEHPEILSGVFDVAEFKKDYELSKDLVPIYDMVNQLADSLRDTMQAVSSDAANGVLEIYSSVKMQCGKVPGLNVVAQEMSEFFKKGRKSPAEEAIAE